MNYTKTSPVGIDIKMNLLQAKLHALLLSDLSLSTGAVNVFGRCYRLREENDTKPVKFISKEVERAIFSNDKSVTAWFYQRAESNNNNGVYSATIANVVHVNLADVYPSITHRADQEFVKELTDMYLIEPYGFRLISITTGIENVYSDFSFTSEAREDVPPFFTVRFDLNINYRI